MAKSMSQKKANEIAFLHLVQIVKKGGLQATFIQASRAFAHEFGITDLEAVQFGEKVVFAVLRAVIPKGPKINQ